MPHWIITELIDVVQCLPKLRTLASYKQSVKRKFNEPTMLFQTEGVSFAWTLYQHKLALSKPYLIWAAVHCDVPPLKNQEEAVEVHDEVTLSKGEVRPANLILIITYWWLSQLTLDYETLTITEQRITHDKNSTINFRNTVTKNFCEKLKGREGWAWGEVEKGFTDINVSYDSSFKLLLYADSFGFTLPS